MKCIRYRSVLPLAGSVLLAMGIGCSAEFQDARLQSRLIKGTRGDRRDIYRQVHEGKRARVLPSIVAAGLFDEFATDISLPPRVGSVDKLGRVPSSQERETLYAFLLDRSRDFGMIRAYDQPASLKSWTGDADPRVRFFAIAWLFDQRVPSAVGDILIEIRRNPDREYPWLTTLCDRIRDSFSDVRILEGIRTGDPWSLAFVTANRGTQFIPEMIRQLDSADVKNAEGLVWTLGLLKAADAVPSILRQLDTDPHRIFQPALRSLMAIGDSTAVPGLLRIQRRWDAQRQMLIWEAIGVLATEHQIGDIQKAMDDDGFAGPEAREAARRALAKVGASGRH